MANTRSTNASAKVGTTAAKAATDAGAAGDDTAAVSGSTAETLRAQQTEADAAADAGDTDGLVEVVLTQHWTDPETGKNHLPESTVRVTPTQAESLRSTDWAEPDVSEQLGGEPAGGRYVRTGEQTQQTAGGEPAGGRYELADADAAQTAEGAETK